MFGNRNRKGPFIGEVLHDRSTGKGSVFIDSAASEAYDEPDNHEVKDVSKARI